MATSPSNIGKSLLKFFKPIVVTLPHRPGRPGAPARGSGDEQSEAFQLLHFKREEAEAKNREPEAADAAPLPIPKVPTHWLEFVLTLLAMCRKVSERMRQRIGINAYRQSVEGLTQQKIQTVGALIDISPELGDRPKKRRAA